MRCGSASILCVALLAATPAAGSAQTLSEVFDGLFTFGECGQALCLPVNAEFHGDHYNPAVTQGQDNLLRFLGVAIGNSVANLPIAAATGGLTFRFEGGVPVAEEISTGPIFGERAQTLTRGRLLVAASVTGASFDEVRGLSTNAIEMTFTHENVGSPDLGDPGFEGDLIQVDADVDVSVLVASFAASYGLLDNLDIGLVVPLVRATLRGSSEAQVIPVGQTTPHQFGTPENPVSTATSSADATASGLGDVGVRLKLGIPTGGDLGFAIVGDVRLPTGAEEDFLGTGEASIRVLGVASARRGDFEPHLNAGVLLRGGEDEVRRGLIVAGLDHLIAPGATLALDVLANLQMGDAPVDFPHEQVYDVPAGRRVDLTNIPDGQDHLLDFSIGGKFSAGSTFRLVTNLVFPLNQGGLRPGLAWTAGFELDTF